MKVRARNNSNSQNGVILILTLFVVMITFALVTQLTVRTAVSYQTANNSANRTRMEYAAITAGEEILRTLADDMPAATEGDGAMDSLADATTEAPGTDAGIGGDGGEGEEEEDDGSNSDSYEDEWARPARFTLGDIEVHAFVQDENSKLNLLTLFDPDEAVAEEARERFVRTLDFLREDMDDDLDKQEATMILDEFIAWVEGDARDLDFPPPRRHSVTRAVVESAETSTEGGGSIGAASSEDDEPVLQEEIIELYLPYSLEELMLLEHVEEELFYDQLRRDDEIAPGLESVFTLYTSMALDPPDTESLEGDGAAAGAEDGSTQPSGSAPDEEGADDGSDESTQTSQFEGGLDDLLEAGAGFGVTINLNTAHPAILHGLLPRSEMPEYIIDSILRYRNEVDEEAMAEQEGEDVDYDEIELQRSIYQEDEPEVHRYFRNLDDLTQVEGWEDRLDPEQAEKFQTLVGVQSDIFSVYLWCRIKPEGWEQEFHYEEPPGPVLRMKAVIWRRQGEEGAKFLFIEPWHEVPFTRWRIPDFQQDLTVFERPLYD
jgi:hypothetical protein